MSENLQNVKAGLTAEAPSRGKEKLQLLKVRLFPPETQPHRVAEALEALRRAKKKSRLDDDTLKYIALHADLEGL